VAARHHRFRSAENYSRGRTAEVGLTRSGIIPRLNDVTIAPLTRSVRNIPTHVRVTRSDGVYSDSAVNLDNIQTIPKSAIFRKIVRLRHERMDEVFAAIRVAFDMPR
jgi:mRNA interferase MazF